MLSAAGVRNCSPTGLNFTAFTPWPVGAVIVIAVGLRSALGPSNDPMRLALGVGAWGWVGSLQDGETSKTSNTTANARTAFIGPSPTIGKGDCRGPAEVQNGTRGPRTP